MIEDFLVAWLKQDATVTGLIGSGDNCRVFPMAAAQGKAFPRVTYSITGEIAYPKLSKGRSGAVHGSIQVDCWHQGDSSKYAEVAALAAAIVGTAGTPKLDGYRGTLGNVSVSLFVLEAPGVQDLSEAPGDGSDDWTYRKSMSFRFVYTEP